MALRYFWSHQKRYHKTAEVFMYIPKLNGAIHRIRNKKRTPVVTICYQTLSAGDETLIEYGLSICSPKDQPVKKKGEMIAFNRLAHVVQSGQTAQAVMHKLEQVITLYGRATIENFEEYVAWLTKQIITNKYYNR